MKNLTEIQAARLRQLWEEEAHFYGQVETETDPVRLNELLIQQRSLLNEMVEILSAAFPEELPYMMGSQATKPKTPWRFHFFDILSRWCFILREDYLQRLNDWLDSRASRYMVDENY